MAFNPLSADFNKFPWVIPLGSVIRIPIRLHVTFFILWIAQTLGSIYYGFWPVMLSLIIFGPVLLLTILVHELGHCVAARSIGGTVDSIMLWPLGGMAYMSYHTTYMKALWVAFAGPLTHIPMVGLWLVLLLPAYHASTGSWRITLDLPSVDQRHFGHALCVYGVVINISLFVFNLLVPAYPLDGGRILAMGLLRCGASPRTTAIITVSLATPIGLGMLVFGIVVFQMVTILVAVFILFATFQLFRAIRANQVEQHPLFASVSADGLGGAGGGSGAAATAGPGGASGLPASYPGSKPGATGSGSASNPSYGGYPGYPPQGSASGPGGYASFPPPPGASGAVGFQPPQAPSSYYYSGNAV